MPRSRPDLMALLDVILLVFFAMTLSKEKQHVQERNKLNEKLTTQVQQTHTFRQELKKKTSHFVSLQKRMRTLQERRLQIYRLVADLQTLIVRMEGKASVGVGAGKQSLQKKLTRMRLQLKQSIEQWRFTQHRLQREHKKLKQVHFLLQKQVRSLQQKLKQAGMGLQRVQALLKQSRLENRSLRLSLAKAKQRTQKLSVLREVLSQRLQRLQRDLAKKTKAEERWLAMEKKLLARQQALVRQSLQQQAEMASMKRRIQVEKNKQQSHQTVEKKLLSEIRKLKHVRELLRKKENRWVKRYADWKSKQQKQALERAAREKMIKRLRVTLRLAEKERSKLRLAYDALKRENKSHLRSIQKLNRRVGLLRKESDKERVRHLKLAAEFRLQSKVHQALQSRAKRLTEQSIQLKRKMLQLGAEKAFLTKANQKLEKRYDAKHLALERLQLAVKGLRATWRKERKSFQQQKRLWVAKNQRILESRKQLADALRMVQRWGGMSAREKAGLTKSLARYFQAVMIYVKADRIVGYRRFPAKVMKPFSRSIELSRRSSNGINLYYRGKIESDFRAFEILERKLPGELASSLEVIYIFVFDDNCSKAITQGLEQEHLKHYRGRRVIWQL